jgi:serine protease Do
MFKKTAVCAALILVSSALCAQQKPAELRNYVGVIHQSYHPDVVAYMNKLKDMESKRGKTGSVKAIEAFLKGGFGSGFVYVDENGNNYILTNYHVVTKAYSLSIEFESVDGKKTRYTGLTIVAGDADVDLALLAFSSGENPFKIGLQFAANAPSEGDTVYSAGFPGLGNTPLWQFAQGIISNGRVLILPDEDDDRQYGPWFQHTAQIDEGNSGGPLLAPQAGVPTGYAVIGINNASGVKRQAANYAIPIATVRNFINSAFARQSVGEKKQKLEVQVAAFIKGLDSNKAVYPRIARYLSNECVASSAEFAISEVEKRANRTVQNDIFDKYILDALDYSVAWVIEDQIRSVAKSVVLRPEMGTVVMNVDGTWTVPLVFGGNKIDTIWMNEYGMWRIKSAGGITGNKVAMEKKASTDVNKKMDTEKLRTAYSIEFFAYYMSLGLDSSNPRGDALAFSIDWRKSKNFRYGVQFVTDLEDFGIAGMTVGYAGAIKIGGKVAIMPFADAGVGISWFEGDEKQYSPYSEEENFDFAFGLTLTGGLMFRVAAVPGLSVKAAYQLNLFDSAFGRSERDVPLPDVKHSFLIGVGYAW